jgi:SAGA-associated factor 29
LTVPNDILIQVAAKQPKQKDKTEEWILAVVISYNADKNK